MAFKITELRGRATEIARHPRTRKIAIWLVAIFAFIGILAASLLARGESFGWPLWLRGFAITPALLLVAVLCGFLLQ